MALGINFDNYESYDSYEPLPNGNYNVIIDSAEIKTPKSGNGRMLSLCYTVSGGEYSGRKIFDNLCIFHNNEMAQTISRRKLKSIKEATGLVNLDEEEQLINEAMLIKVKVKKNSEGVLVNEISGYYPIESIAEKYNVQPAQNQVVTLNKPNKTQNLNEIYADNAPPYAVDESDIPF